jgi:integrase
MGKLTALRVKNAKAGDKLSDGDGLRLDVDHAGNKNWVFRYTSPTTGKERFMGLGPARDVSLAQAREAAAGSRAVVRLGKDPIDERNAQRAALRVETSRAVTFKAYAEQFVTNRESSWTTKNANQWRSGLRDYAFPIIGHLPVSGVDTVAVLAVLRPIWNDKVETANRMRGRIEMILTGAKVEKLRVGDNPAAWRGHLSEVLTSKRRAVRHHAALPYGEMPRFWRSLSADTSDAALLLRFTILTAVRYGEAARADWGEIVGATWSIPADRMKARRPHVVPLVPPALAVLAAARERYGAAGMVFPGMRSGRPISDVSLTKAIRRHTKLPATTHGFRSAFRDWCGDATDFPRELAEAALAHTLGPVEAAYRRSDALEKRRALMEAWASFVEGEGR